MIQIIGLTEGGKIHFTKNTPPEYTRSAFIFTGSSDFLNRSKNLFLNHHLEVFTKSFFSFGKDTIYTFCDKDSFFEILKKHFYLQTLSEDKKSITSYKETTKFDEEASSPKFDYSFSEEEVQKISEEKSLIFLERSVIYDSVKIPNLSSVFEKIRISKK